MNPVKKINHELAIAGQISLEQLQQLAAEGYQTVLNLRSPDENGFSNCEAQKTENLGLCYLNIPTYCAAMNSEIAVVILQQMAVLPKPILLHCDTGMRAAAIAFMDIALKQGIAPDQAFLRATQFGLA